MSAHAVAAMDRAVDVVVEHAEAMLLVIAAKSIKLEIYGKT